jgi:hypothetical protein
MKFTVYDNKIDEDIILKCGIHLMALIESDLKIYNNGILFFDEPYINLLELSVQLYKWMKNIFKKDFVYLSIDHEDKHNIPLI